MIVPPPLRNEPVRRVAATIETGLLVWYRHINAMGHEDLITEYGGVWGKMDQLKGIIRDTLPA